MISHILEQVISMCPLVRACMPKTASAAASLQIVSAPQLINLCACNSLLNVILKQLGLLRHEFPSPMASLSPRPVHQISLHSICPLS